MSQLPWYSWCQCTQHACTVHRTAASCDGGLGMGTHPTYSSNKTCQCHDAGQRFETMHKPSPPPPHVHRVTIQCCAAACMQAGKQTMRHLELSRCIHWMHMACAHMIHAACSPVMKHLQPECSKSSTTLMVPPLAAFSEGFQGFAMQAAPARFGPLTFDFGMALST